MPECLASEQLMDSDVEQSEFTDYLLDCLVLITQLKQNPYTADALRAGLPLVDNKLTPELFVRAAKRAGLRSKLVKRSLSNISPLVLPVVLLLKEGQACVLTKVYKDKTADIIFPEVGEGTTRISLKDLQEQYAGYAFFIHEVHQYESRTYEHGIADKPRSWFWGTLWRFKRYYAQVVLASVFVNLFALAVPIFVMIVYNRVIPNNTVETLWVLAIGIAFVFMFDFIMRTLRAFFIDKAGKKIDIVLASNLFEQALGIKMSAKPASTGVHANQLRDFENIREFFTSATIAGFADLPFIALFLWVIGMIGGPVVIVPLTAVPIMIISAVLISIPLNRAVSKSFVGSSQKHAILIEALNNLDVIKSISAEGVMQGKWERYVGVAAEASLKSRFLSTLAMNITIIVTYSVTVCVVVWGVYLIDARELSIGGLIACTILSSRALGPLGQITSLLTRYQLSKYSLRALNSVMELPRERPERHKFLHRKHFNGAIEIDDVYFNYPGEETPIFKGISLHIKPHEKVGIIGSMGSGKSTLLKLLMNFYEPNSGAIRIDGTDIAQIDPADLRRHVGYVQQDPKLFFGTVRENITMKAPWVDDSVVLKCAQISGADSFIGRHPAGYDMPIGESNQGLSGGQCQAITIARALVLSPSILFLDEPTSSMDNSSEALFVRNLQEWAKNKTIVLVTHKMSMLSLVDRLVVLQNGRIIADGPKDKVVAALKQLNKE